MIGAAIVGVGHCVPERVVTNHDIAEHLGVEEEWLTSRTGTRERHVSGPDERLEALAAAAAGDALKDAGIDATEVDLVLVGTTSAEEMSPHAAPMVAADIGATGAGAMDVSAACTGFLASLTMAAGLVEAGRARTVVVVGADALYRYLDKDDRGTAMLFGDGAGAVVLTAVAGPSQVGPAIHHSDGDGRGLISLGREDRLIRMDGPTVYRYAVASMTEVTREALDRAGLSVDDVDLYFYHQANARIIDAVGRRLHLPGDRVVNVIGDFANTSAASLPIALSVARRQGRLRDGHRILLSAFGAGMVWGAAVATWGRPEQTSREE
ncbi:MAG TPA: beta-ketoacyl-ACP synthase 3 [Marmoricola sp.]|nr:beta-ketoacyl-ACP synthase 3 [Marmoricola sp.]